MHMFKCNILRLTYLSPSHSRRAYDFHFQVWWDEARCLVTNFRISCDSRQTWNAASTCNLNMVYLSQRSGHKIMSTSNVFFTSTSPFRYIYLSLSLPRHAICHTPPDAPASPSSSCPWRAVCGLFHSAPANQSCCHGWWCQRCSHQQGPLGKEREETV